MKINVKEITIHWAEGGNQKYDKFPKTYSSYAEVNEALNPIYEDFAEIVRSDIQIAGGRGDRHLRFVAKPDMPSSLEVLEEEIKAQKKGEKMEVLYINKDMVNDYRYHIALSVISKPRRTTPAKISKAIQKYTLYSQNPLFDQEWNARNLAERSVVRFSKSSNKIKSGRAFSWIAPR